MTVAENHKNSAAKYALETNVVEKWKTRGKFPNIETRKGKSLMYNNFFYFFSPPDRQCFYHNTFCLLDQSNS